MPIGWLGMAVRPEPNGKTRNPRHLGRVWVGPMGFGPGLGFEKKNFAGLGRVWDYLLDPITRPDYPIM